MPTTLSGKPRWQAYAQSLQQEELAPQAVRYAPPVPQDAKQPAIRCRRCKTTRYVQLFTSARICLSCVRYIVGLIEDDLESHWTGDRSYFQAIKDWAEPKALNDPDIRTR